MSADVEHFFTCALSTFTLYGEESVQILFFTGLLVSLWHLERSLQILKASSLPDTWSARIFPPPVTCLFILLPVSFQDKFWWSSIYQFFLLQSWFSVVSKKSLPNSRSQRYFVTMFSFQSATVLDFTFKSAVHLEWPLYVV